MSIYTLIDGTSKNATTTANETSPFMISSLDGMNICLNASMLLMQCTV